MKILITGATGFLGRRVCDVLSQAGHTLVALSRDPQRAKQLVPQLTEVFGWDALAQALQGCDAVVHLAGETVVGRWTDAKKKAIRDSRVLSTRELVNALAQLSIRPKVLISASAIGYYGNRGEEPLTEDSSPGSDFLAQVCQDWESEAARAESLGIRVVRLRIGLLLGPGGGALQAILPLFKLGLGGPLGLGNQFWSWVHRDDVVGAIAFALERDELRGPVNMTAPNPVRQREFAQVLGRVLRRPAVLLTPAFALKIVLGEFASELLSSKRVLPQRLHQLGYRFRFAELEPALREILRVP
ncbi:MAG: TIGR01777 family oxidoreductase [Candidatus Bipolaricaulota bacterium]|nr:TIGR01777 family oxidoreductase [Candidatus Bipolaricaulota bacterium]MDW8030318.1 TIGR01777 family oxidoreductase [Candidatus Bipolaricaulota bacterium]